MATILIKLDDKLTAVRDQLAVSEGQRRALEELSNVRYRRSLTCIEITT